MSYIKCTDAKPQGHTQTHTRHAVLLICCNSGTHCVKFMWTGRLATSRFDNSPGYKTIFHVTNYKPASHWLGGAFHSEWHKLTHVSKKLGRNGYHGVKSSTLQPGVHLFYFFWSHSNCVYTRKTASWNEISHVLSFLWMCAWKFKSLNASGN